MSQKQLNRFAVISKLIDGHLTIAEAAVSLGLSERQIIRLKKGVATQGAEFLIHKNTNRKPVHAIDDAISAKIVALKQSEPYQSANFLHFQELLERHEAIKISYSALHSILTQANIKSPKKCRRFKPHRRRKRKPQEGLLIQMDATPFEWFGTNEKFALHGAIDDATGTRLLVDSILCVKLTRSVDAGGVFSFYNRHFKVITGSSLPLLPPKSKVNVLVGPRLGVKVQFKNAIYDVLSYIKAKKSAVLRIQDKNTLDTAGQPLLQIWSSTDQKSDLRGQR